MSDTDHPFQPGVNAVTSKRAPEVFTAEVVADLERLAALAKGDKP